MYIYPIQNKTNVSYDKKNTKVKNNISFLTQTPYDSFKRSNITFNGFFDKFRKKKIENKVEDVRPGIEKEYPTEKYKEILNSGDMNIISDYFSKVGVNKPLKGYTFAERILHVACLLGHIEHFNILLQLPDIDINVRDREGKTPLYHACVANRPAMISALLERDDIDVNRSDYNGTTPLHLAVYWNDPDLFRALLTRDDIDLTMKDSDGLTAEQLAKKRGCTTMKRILDEINAKKLIDAQILKKKSLLKKI